MTTGYDFRFTTLDDVDTIFKHRFEMFAEMGMDRDMLVKSREYYMPWLRELLSDKKYVGIFVECDRQVIAGAGMWYFLGAPLPNLHSSDYRRASIVNVYTHPDHRRKGLARELMERLIDEARKDGIPVIVLHASGAGRPLYESLGFQNTNEFRLML